MNKILPVLSITILLTLGCSSSKNHIDLGYEDYSNLNPLLQLSANSTIRASETILDVKDFSKAVYTVKEALTIYDKEDKDLAQIVIFYDDFVSVNRLNATIRDKRGEVVRTFSINDAEDYSATGGSFFSDNRVKVLNLLHNSFPYTIEVEYEQTYSGLLNLPSWFPQSIGQSVESSTFTLIDRGNTGVRYLTQNMDMEPEIQTEGGVKKYTWDMGFSLPIKREPLGPSSRDLLPHVLVAPGKFKMENSEGVASTWKDFGKWYYDLGKETRVLPEEAKKEIDLLVSGVNSDTEKVQILYNYLQEKTRYVSIQLGIGGWKPYSAEYVFNNSYGDCKALTNYMHAALEHVGIKAESVLIRNGVNSPEMIANFPSNQFNHVIIRVTLENGDVIWLECTSKYLMPNRIGSGNEGKEALLITENGGELIETPLTDHKQNLSASTLNFSILEDGNARLEGEVESRGFMQDIVLNTIIPVSEKERVEWVERGLDVDKRKVIDYDFTPILERDEESKYRYVADLESYASSSSKRLFIPINRLNRWQLSIPEEDSRTQPVKFPYVFTETDSAMFVTPGSFEVESMPQDIEYSYSFGEYKATFSLTDENELIYVRHFSIKEKSIEPDKYADFKDFFDKVRYADSQQLVLVREGE